MREPVEPADAPGRSSRRREEALADRAKELLLARLRAQPVANAGRWTRDELYDDPA